MAIAINSNFERDQLVATAGQTVFTYSFPIFEDDYLNVFKYSPPAAPNDATQKLVLGIDYTVQGVGLEAGGTITLVIPATGGDIITIVGAEPIDRLSVFDDLNPFTIALNQQLNELTVMTQQVYTQLQNVTPHYNLDELISAPSILSGPGVRPDKRILPMLPNGYVWVGRGSIGVVPDDIVAMPYNAGGGGGGNVFSTGNPMRQSIANWTGVGTQITDTNINIVGDFFDETAGVAANSRTGFTGSWGAMHWPDHVTGNRPLLPIDGDTYYDTTLQQFFGYQNGMWVAFSTGAANNNTQILVITQANTFLPGEWVRIDVATGLYVLALGDNSLDAETWWMVISPPNPFQFTIQGGVSFIQGAFLTAIIAGAGNIGKPFYLSDTTPGGMTIMPPTIAGEVNKPVFIPDRIDGGWILSARGFVVGVNAGSGGGGSTTDPTKVTVNFANTFVKGDVIYATGANTYALATAQGTFAQADDIGVVSVAGSPIFTYQTEGNAINIITVDELGAPIVPGTQYWLSDNPAHLGKVTAVKPTVVGHYTVPVYQPYDVAAGVIARQRPLIVPAAAGGGGMNLITSYVLNNDTSHLFSGIFDGTYQDIQIVGENIIMRNTATNEYYGAGIAIRLEVGGVLRSDANYYGVGANPLYTSILMNIPSQPTGVTAWTNNNNNNLTIGGKQFNFTVDMLGIDSTNTYKHVDLYYNYFGTFNSFTPSRSQFGQQVNVFLYGPQTLNTQAITGFEIFFDPPAGGPFIFISGTISVYGTAT